MLFQLFLISLLSLSYRTCAYRPILIITTKSKFTATKTFDFEVIRTDGIRKFDKCVENIESKFSSVRASGTNANILDNISVTCFGNHVSLRQIAHISPVSSSEILVEPYDPTIVKEIEVGILKSALNLSPRSDGKCIRVSIPQLSEEQRKSLTKLAKEISEDGKIVVRNIRRELLEKVKCAEKEKSIGKDISKSYQVCL
jgi:ribosome recycling factor